MREASDRDAESIIRLLRWASLKGDGSTADKEARRKISKLLKKMQRKWQR